MHETELIRPALQPTIYFLALPSHSMVLRDLAGALIIFCGYSAPIDICFEPSTLTFMNED